MPYKDKSKRSENNKKYREANKEKLTVYLREYRLKNLDRLKEKQIERKNRNAIEFKCKTCGIKCIRGSLDKRDKRRFCSSACALTDVRTHYHQVSAGKKAGLINIERYRGTGTKTYVKENRRHQHRVVAEKMLGRKLIRGEIVHHIDRNKKNNSPDNLMVMTQSEHFKLHIKEDACFKNKKKC